MDIFQEKDAAYTLEKKKKKKDWQSKEKLLKS